MATWMRKKTFGQCYQLTFGNGDVFKEKNDRGNKKLGAKCCHQFRVNMKQTHVLLSHETMCQTYHGSNDETNLETTWNTLQYGYWEVAFLVSTVSAVQPRCQCQDDHHECIAQHRNEEKSSLVTRVSLGEGCKRPFNRVQG